jgi:hypothetical protein
MQIEQDGNTKQQEVGRPYAKRSANIESPESGSYRAPLAFGIPKIEQDSGD